MGCEVAAAIEMNGNVSFLQELLTSLEVPALAKGPHLNQLDLI